MPTATRKSEQTRQRLLDAAAKVLRDKGYAGTRLADIAEAAGMHTPGVYYYFGSKEELVAEVLRTGVARAQGFVEERVAAVPEGRPALDRLRAAIEGHVLMVLEIGDYTSANIRVFGQLPDEIRRQHLARQRAYGDLWRSLLEAARSSGELRPDLDLSVIRMLILGALNWTVEWYRSGMLPAAEVARHATTMICDGLSPAAPGGASSSATGCGKLPKTGVDRNVSR
ncbi:MAG TPA: TetR/AcrR family transcriptional regulator [Acidimicrobiia bacterium]|nr:TetR/AcrR family transcriptional regulator [Acidimicrobiia bacterium]